MSDDKQQPKEVEQAEQIIRELHIENGIDLPTRMIIDDNVVLLAALTCGKCGLQQVVKAFEKNKKCKGCHKPIYVFKRTN